MKKFKLEFDSVSPVIGVILLVTVTVVLFTLAILFLFNIGSWVY